MVNMTGSRAGETATKISDDLQDLGGKVRDMAQDKFEQARAGAAEWAEEGRERMMQLEHNLESYIEENPITAVLIAAGVGMLAGCLWSRR